MKKYLTFLFLILTAVQFISCNKKNEELPQEKAPTYKMFTFDRKTGDCGSIKSSCAEIKFDYPQITDASNKEAMNKINQNIMSTLLAPYGEDKSYTNFDSMANDFLSSFNEFQKQFSDRNQSWTIERNISVSGVNNSVFSLTNTEFYYMGGAHPNSTTSFINFNLQTGEALELDDLFKPGFEDALNKVGEKIFREKQKLKPGENLNEAGYWFDKNNFELNDNFLIKKKGLLFVFNPYEVAAYVYGAIEVFIPYKEIKDLIKDDSVLNLYLNND